MLVVAQPTIWPLLLIAAAGLPNVPSWVAVPFCQSTAWMLLLVSSQVPMIWPLLLIALAPQLMGVKVLGSGSWVIVPLLSRQACKPGLFPQVPAIWPRSLIAGRAHCAQVDHRLAVPEERVGESGLGVRQADHLARQVDRLPLAVVPAQGAKIVHRAVAVQERVLGVVPRTSSVTS